MSKKRILVISPGIPYPPIDGHKLKIYNLLMMLNIDHDVELVVITSEKLSKDAEDFLKQVCSEFKIFSFSPVRFFFNLFRAIDPRIPFQVAYYTFARVEKYLRSRSDKYDYVFLNLIRTVEYSKIFKQNKVILDLVDSIGINYLRSRKSTESFLHRFIYNLEAKRLLGYEKQMVAQARLSLFVNKYEADYYSKYGNVKWLPNGVNKELLEINFHNSDYENAVCFFGAMFYQPNIDAVVWFIKNVLPQLNEDIKFYIVGQNPSKKLFKYSQGNKNIVITGYLDTPYEILKSALCTVAPMQSGGGIQNKILESMALGQVTITNNLGANPIIGACNKENLLIANTGAEISALINALYHDRKPFESIGNNARLFIKENFSWESHRKFLNDFWK